MARDSPVLGSEGDDAMNVDQEEKKSNNEASEAGEEDGSEYEIEQILDAKRGAFPEGRMGYLVKWKGYGPEENSWVDEQDTENAKELVDEFWKKNPKKHPRKSMEAKQSRRGRPSMVQDDESDQNSVAKKRGRKSAVKSDSEEDEQVPVRSKRAKKPEKLSTKGKLPEPHRLSNMSKYMDRDTWEDLVDTVDTVERTEEGLIIYFTLKNGESIRERGAVCRKRFPQKLLSFYESNLKWRVAEVGDD